MAIEFHRLVAPAYDEDTLSTTHDLINDPALNTPPGTGVPSVVDGMKSGGPNSGTYFIAFGEDGTSFHFNRGFQALAENTDFLDDIVHADLATPVVVDVVIAGSPSNTVAITAEVFVGVFGTVNNPLSRNGLAAILDVNGLPFVKEDPSFNRIGVAVNKIHNGSGINVIGQEAGGFFTNPSVEFTTPLLVGSHKLVYFTRASVKGQGMSVLSRLGSGLEFDSRAYAEALKAQNFYPAGPIWHDATPNPAASMYTRVAGIITDLVDDAGSDRIGSAAITAWHDATPNPASSIYDRFKGMVDDLIADAGSDRIGSDAIAGTHLALSASDSIYDQLGDLTGFINTNHIKGLVNTLFSVKNYGAIGNGIADDEPAIQDAIDAAAVGGGVVMFPPGTYNIEGDLDIPSNVSLWAPAGPMVTTISAGASIQILDFDGGFVAGLQSVVGLRLVNGVSTSQRMVHLSNDTYVSFDNCHLDAINTTNASILGETVSGGSIRINNCWFLNNSSGSAIRCYGPDHTVITKCYFKPLPNVHSTIYLRETDATVSDCRFDNALVTSGTNTNIQINDDAEVTVTGCHFLNDGGATLMRAFYFAGEQDKYFSESGNTFEDGVTPYTFSIAWNNSLEKRIFLGTREGNSHYEEDMTGGTHTFDALRYGSTVVERQDAGGDLDVSANNVGPPGAKLTVIVHNDTTGGSLEVDFTGSYFRATTGTNTLSQDNVRIWTFISAYVDGAGLRWFEISDSGNIPE